MWPWGRGPLDLMREAWVESKRPKKEITQYLTGPRDRLIAVQDAARSNEGRAKRRMKKWYDSNTRKQSF